VLLLLYHISPFSFVIEGSLFNVVLVLLEFGT